MHLLREAGVKRPPPHLKIVGTEHLDAALQAGKGGILWVSLFCHAALMSKRALSEAGYVVNHLSVPEHGGPDTSFGRRFLAPLHQLIEDRFLASRVTLQPGGTVRAMRELIGKLQRNEFVSITVLGAGVQTVEVPFLNSSISLARGPLTLGLRTGAPVLPVFTVRLAPNRFEISVLPRLDMTSENPNTASPSAFSEYSRALEERVRAFPDQWGGWEFLACYEGSMVGNSLIIQPRPLTHITDLFILTYNEA